MRRSPQCTDEYERKMVMKRLSLGVLETAIKSSTSLDDLKRLVADADAAKIMKKDGTIRGLCYFAPSGKRGAVLTIAIKRGSLDGLSTSMIVDGKDFRTIYHEMVNLIAAHYGLVDGCELFKEMHGSADAFLAKNGLELKEVRYEQVTKVSG